MRLALISDIHGNDVALGAVLADINHQHIDQILFLGDLVTLGPQPRPSIERIKALDCPCILGNHESYLFDPDLYHNDPNMPPALINTLDWCRAYLTEEELNWLDSFQPMLEIPLGNTASMLCVHGSPRSNFDFLLATTPAEEVDAMLAGHKATVIIGGHTHLPMIRQYKGMLIVNTGSVGMPLEEFPPANAWRYLLWAEYAIVDAEDDDIRVELCRVPVDYDLLKQSALTSENPFAAEWLENWVLPQFP